MFWYFGKRKLSVQNLSLYNIADVAGEKTQHQQSSTVERHNTKQGQLSYVA